jgi:CRP-like cAMP-binding protein
MRVDLVKQLDELAISMPVSRGSLIFRCGAPVSAVYVVRSGRIVLVWMGPDHVYPMDALGPGSIMGLPAALSGEYNVDGEGGRRFGAGLYFRESGHCDVGIESTAGAGQRLN